MRNGERRFKMNDCFWFCVRACECEKGTCNQYLSVNSKKGQELYDAYQREISEAIKPVVNRWSAKKNGGKNNV